jgi:NAD(P)-dependent dehydrogenase (short-subunit alcohol dehydrogenase family)
MKIDINTVVFVTGGGSGFGLETVLKFYALGCRIVLADIALTPDAKTFIRDVLVVL